ncbi:FkbM family methyltransferase [Pseudomonas sp. N040]|uniref:FkbM family methyltransferase n=1 Tax=Pseudomonas sp. N040 TaxID=2785325 RepID=UPI0018A3102E|nr:FkbM family methyltransferase [Pseudomonas sp. N040]MBF7728938.1 FkbM family methyltransferase [Pseudomonas sp. N040]MBW7012578.1 FkbM family methyltransferase [Pseudomonas sp. N040]
MIQREIVILGQRRTVAGDRDYLGQMGDEFEADTTALLAALCNPDATAVDIGANIGLTTLALSAICSEGSVLAIEPVPVTFTLLDSNLATAGVQNVSTFNVALGAAEGSVSMYVDASNLATSFVVGIDAGAGHEIPMTSLDSLVSRQQLQRLDFIKIDVEGCELEVLKGAQETLARFQPIVMLEMNHWCLNVFRRVSLPEFRDRLLELFPCVYAVDHQGFLDFSEPLNAGSVYHAHVFENRYMNLVAGFDRKSLLARLGRLPMAAPSAAGPCADAGRDSAEQQLQAVLDSTSWKLTAPLRRLCHWAKTSRKG